MTTSTPNPGLLPMIFAHAAYSATPQTVIEQYPDFTSGWNVVWYSDFTQPNYVFVASNGTDYAVAIRGSLFQFSKDAYVDWIREDLKVFTQFAWDWFVGASTAKPVIAQGAYTGLTTLQGLAGAGSDSSTLPDFLITNAANNNAAIMICGHSLGGNLSSVFAPWMQWYINNDTNSNFNGKNTVYSAMQVFTFAAPAAGNQDFVSYYDSLFGSNASRFYNTNDIVPTFPADIGTTADMFNGGPNASDITVTIDKKQVSLHDFFEGVRVAVLGDMILHGNGAYEQTNATSGAYPFATALNQSYMANTIEDWLDQAGAQHSGVNYLNYFLGQSQSVAK